MQKSENNKCKANSDKYKKQQQRINNIEIIVKKFKDVMPFHSIFLLILEMFYNSLSEHHSHNIITAWMDNSCQLPVKWWLGLAFISTCMPIWHVTLFAIYLFAAIESGIPSFTSSRNTDIIVCPRLHWVTFTDISKYRELRIQHKMIWWLKVLINTLIRKFGCYS